MVKKATLYELEYAWQIKGNDVVSIVTRRLEPSANGTLLTLTHQGISAYEENEVRMFESCNGGWENCITGLTPYLRKQVHV